jgi:hypothetical protein
MAPRSDAGVAAHLGGGGIGGDGLINLTIPAHAFGAHMAAGWFLPANVGRSGDRTREAPGITR